MSTWHYSKRAKRIIDESLRFSNRHKENCEISLAVGEPSFRTPPTIIEAGSKALNNGETHYAPQEGHPSLIEAILEYGTEQWRASRENILITHGGTAGLVASIMGIVDKDDVVLIEDPTYSLYMDAINMAGGVIRRFTRNTDGTLNFDSIKQNAERAKLVIICQPSNPTGAIVSRDDWKRLARVVHESNVAVLCDEAYEGIVYDGVEFVSALDIVELRDRLVVSRTFSKKYAMTGWRLGYLVGERRWIAAATIMHRTFNGAVNTANQLAGIAALRHARGEVEKMRKEFQRRRSLMDECLGELPSIQYARPQGAFYFWVKYASRLGDSIGMAARARRFGVIVRPGVEFGPSGQHALRLSYAADYDSIVQGVARLRNILEKLEGVK